jgi:hypothetical protein
MTEAEARAALTMFRLTVQVALKTLREWDFQGKQQRLALIFFLESAEITLEKVLAKPKGKSDDLNKAIKTMSEGMVVFEAKLAEAMKPNSREAELR